MMRYASWRTLLPMLVALAGIMTMTYLTTICPPFLCCIGQPCLVRKCTKAARGCRVRARVRVQEKWRNCAASCCSIFVLLRMTGVERSAYGFQAFQRISQCFFRGLIVFIEDDQGFTPFNLACKLLSQSHGPFLCGFLHMCSAFPPHAEPRPPLR